MSDRLKDKLSQGAGTLCDVEGRYTTLASERSNFLERAREFSQMTLPYLLPDTSPRSGNANQSGFSSIGAQAVNHLANKLVITMFPPQTSFFKIEFTEETEQELSAAGYDPTELAQLLATAEKRARNQQEKIAARIALVEVMKHLLVSGNVLLKSQGKNKPLQAIPLDRYVMNLSLDGRLLELITVQEKEFQAYPVAVQSLIKSAGKAPQSSKEMVKLYTYAYRSSSADNTFYVAQTACGVLLQDRQEVSEELLPWIPLRWNTCYGEDYGRGLVEDHAGDFHMAEFLSEALAKGMVLMADVKYLVRQGSTIDIDQLALAPTGEFIEGNIDDVGVLQLAKYADFTPIDAVLQRYEKRIGQNFMMNSAIRRNAERVTTYELRLDAQELETSLGGIYSQLSQTLQLPLANMLLRQIDFTAPDAVRPVVLTGLEALGRVGDLDKIMQFSEMMNIPASWPQQMQARTKYGELARVLAASLSMEIPWMMTDTEFNQAQQQQQQAEQANMLAQEAAKAAPDLAKQAINPEGG